MIDYYEILELDENCSKRASYLKLLIIKNFL